MNGSSVKDSPVSVNLNEAPKSDDGINSLWASRVGGRIVGLVHVVGAGPDAAAITLFRVDPEYRHTAILTNLIDRVRDYCLQQGRSWLRMESHVAPHWVLRQFGARGLHPVRRTLAGGRDVLDFRVEPALRPARAAQRCPPRWRDADEDWWAIDDVMDALVSEA